MVDMMADGSSISSEVSAPGSGLSLNSDSFSTIPPSVTEASSVNIWCVSSALDAVTLAAISSVGVKAGSAARLKG